MKKLLTLFVITSFFLNSCQKEEGIIENKSSNNIELRNNSIGEYGLDVFFNPIFVRDQLDLAHEYMVSSFIFFDAMEQLFLSDSMHEISSTILNYYGLPCWSCGEIAPNYSDFLLIPSIDVVERTVTGVILVNTTNEEFQFEFLDRKKFENESGSIDYSDI